MRAERTAPDIPDLVESTKPGAGVNYGEAPTKNDGQILGLAKRFPTILAL
jgi:hypothetical protein